MSERMEPVYRYRVHVDRVIDGNTFVALVDLGFSLSYRIPQCRLANVKALIFDESKTDEDHSNQLKAYAARTHLEQRIGGRDVICTFQEIGTGWAAIIHLPIDDAEKTILTVNDEMVQKGLAEMVPHGVR